jgi:hypothetical protein
MSANYSESDAARIILGSMPSPERDAYEQQKAKWIADQIAKCPPLSESQKSVIRTAFAQHLTEGKSAA